MMIYEEVGEGREKRLEFPGPASLEDVLEAVREKYPGVSHEHLEIRPVNPFCFLIKFSRERAGHIPGVDYMRD